MNNTNSILFSVPFANIGGSNVTQPAIGTVPIHRCRGVQEELSDVSNSQRLCKERL